MKRINRAVCGTVAVFGVFVAFAGLVLCMCETPDIMSQLRNMLVGLALIIGGSAMAYIGGTVHWRDRMPDYEGAVSFPGVIPPEDAEEIDRKYHPTLGTVIYYKAPKTGTIYYATKRGLRFAAKMERVIQKKKTKK